MRLWVGKSWTGLWWLACRPDEPLALFDSPTYVRSWTREGVIEKARRRWSPKPYGEFIDVEPLREGDAR